MSKGKEFLSQLKFYSDYAKWNEEKGRYETWEEACESVLDTHRQKYGDKVETYIQEILPFYKDKEILVSQRTLQFRGQQVIAHNVRLYNCSNTYCYSPDYFSKAFYVLLCGAGLGTNMFPKFIEQLPTLNKREKGTKTFVIPDSIEGWAESAKVLISSYCKHPSLYKEYFGYIINFDYSLIRPKGAFITGGFKAPGPDGLKQSLERIEAMVDREIAGESSIKFRSIIAYDILMHLSDAVLSGGVRRSATLVEISPDDKELLAAKTGNWRQTHPWRARSNNSVGLIRHSFSISTLKELISLNQGDNDLGFLFMDTEEQGYNPCMEICLSFYNQIQDKTSTAFSFCNLCEINASACKTSSGSLDKNKFFAQCRAASIAGTLQAGWTDFPYLGDETKHIVEGEALLGVSITGWFDNPELFEDEVLRAGAEIVKQTNEEVAKVIGINSGARLTCVKPSGNASSILKTPSGIHGEHSRRYFRIMQLNKEAEVAKWLTENKPDMLEESVWSANKTDYVVFVPCEASETGILKDDLKGVKHLEKIKLVQNSWVNPGKISERCYYPASNNNVSCTVIVDDYDQIAEYLYQNQDDFTAVSFLSDFGDKDYNQAPFTSVLTTEQLVETYGDGAIFMSGLIVDGLHCFDDNLWDAADHLLKPDLKLVGTRTQVLLQKDWLRRAKKFAKNYFKGDMTQTVYCMKDVHLWHKWKNIMRGFKVPDFNEILKAPEYKGVDQYGALSCSGSQCELVF